MLKPSISGQSFEKEGFSNYKKAIKPKLSKYRQQASTTAR